MTATTIGVWVLTWTVSGLGSAWLADRKGLSPSKWLYAGLLLGVVGLIMISLADDVSSAAPTGHTQHLWGGASEEVSTDQ
jgi:hypothetical protein